MRMQHESRPIRQFRNLSDDCLTNSLYAVCEVFYQGIDMDRDISNRKRRIISGVAGALLLLLYFVIFFMSAQNGEESGSVSLKISEKCAELVNAFTGGHWSRAFQENLASYFEHPLRKLAHLTEYALMGSLVFVLLRQWIRKGRRLYCSVIVWVLLSAAADEFHQFFVPGRYASVADVLLDTCGGVFGMGLSLLCIKLMNKHIEDVI